MKTYKFSINISPDDFLLVYQGSAKSVIVREYGGKTISLPAAKFMPFLNHNGVQGHFCLQLDDYGKFIKLQLI